MDILCRNGEPKGEDERKIHEENNFCPVDTLSAPDTARGCKTKTGNETPGTAGSIAPPTSGASAKELVACIGPNPESIDPALNSAVDGGNYILWCFDTLLAVDRDNKIIGGGPRRGRPARTPDLDLPHAPGLKWSDGSPLTAEDFVYSWKRVADPNTAAPYARPC